MEMNDIVTDGNMKIPKFASLLSDSEFKAVLAEPRNKEVLRQLINLILPEDRQVAEIEEYEDRRVCSRRYFLYICRAGKVPEGCRAAREHAGEDLLCVQELGKLGQELRTEDDS